jgi:hypothetical protein
MSEMSDEKFMARQEQMCRMYARGDPATGAEYAMMLGHQEFARLLALAKLGVECKQLGKRARNLLDDPPLVVAPQSLLRDLAERCEALEKGEGG